MGAVRFTRFDVCFSTTGCCQEHQEAVVKLVSSDDTARIATRWLTSATQLGNLSKTDNRCSNDVQQQQTMKHNMCKKLTGTASHHTLLTPNSYSAAIMGMQLHTYRYGHICAGIQIWGDRHGHTGIYIYIYIYLCICICIVGAEHQTWGTWMGSTWTSFSSLAATML